MKSLFQQWSLSNCFISTIDNIGDSGELAKFWLAFVDMAKVLLSTIYATRSGNWDLLIESLLEIIPFTFTYYRIHYVRYLNGVLPSKKTKKDLNAENLGNEAWDTLISVKWDEMEKLLTIISWNKWKNWNFIFESKTKC